MAADWLRFRSPPQTEVGFFGSPERETFSGSERTNLPEPVEAGADYRDVRVAYRLATALRRTGQAAGVEELVEGLEDRGRPQSGRRGDAQDRAEPEADPGSEDGSGRRDEPGRPGDDSGRG